MSLNGIFRIMVTLTADEWSNLTEFLIFYIGRLSLFERISYGRFITAIYEGNLIQDDYQFENFIKILQLIERTEESTRIGTKILIKPDELPKEEDQANLNNVYLLETHQNVQHLSNPKASKEYELVKIMLKTR